MEKNLEFLNQARVTFSELLIQIGIEQLNECPLASPEEFVDTFMPPYDDILMILKKEHSRVKNKKRLKEIKMQRQRRGRLKSFDLCCTELTKLFLFSFRFRQ